MLCEPHKTWHRPGEQMNKEMTRRKGRGQGDIVLDSGAHSWLEDKRQSNKGSYGGNEDEGQPQDTGLPWYLAKQMWGKKE